VNILALFPLETIKASQMAHILNRLPPGHTLAPSSVSHSRHASNRTPLVKAAKAVLIQLAQVPHPSPPVWSTSASVPVCAALFQQGYLAPYWGLQCTVCSSRTWQLLCVSLRL
jgi:hypothetical protein